MKQQILGRYIPLDKSWTIRMGVLDLLDGNSDNVIFILEEQKRLSDDLIALKRVCRSWNSKDVIDVGESGTLYRFLQFASWKFGLGKKFIIHGTLEERDICDNPKIIGYSLKKLLQLDNGTSQWASAAVLCGKKGEVANPPYKLARTYKAVKYWNIFKAHGTSWQPIHDATILSQVTNFIFLLNGKESIFKPRQSEDYCFARAFDFVIAKQGEKLWPSLKGHESNRIKEMEKTLDEYRKGKEITSRDHRVLQAIFMKAKVERKKISCKHPDSVNKSWPQFWDFLANTDSITVEYKRFLD